MINPFRKVNCFKENTTFSVYAYNITASVLIKCTLYSKDGDFNFFFFFKTDLLQLAFSKKGLR